MRGSLFGLRSGTNSAVGSPVQTPTSTPHQQPASRPDSGAISDVVEPLSLPPPASSVLAATASPRARPLNRLSNLTPFRKPNPSPGPAAVPTPSASPAPTVAAVSSGSYLDSLGLKLGEAVNKALAAPAATQPAKAPYVPTTSGAKTAGVSDGSDAVLKGKKPLPAGRGRALGAMIASEIHHATTVLQDSFLHRAIIRLLQRPLTVLNTNLTQQVTNLILTPEFAATTPLVTFNPTQVHALALAHFASELLETFDALQLGRAAQRGQVGSESLRTYKEGLENVVTRVVSPFVAAIKAELASVITTLETGDATAADRLDKTAVRVAPLLARVTFSGDVGQSVHVQSILATLDICAIWTSLVALSNRAIPQGLLPSSQMESGLGLRRTMSEGKLRSQPSDGSLSSASGESSPPDYGRLPAYITPPDTPQVAPTDKEKKPAEGQKSPSSRQLTPPSSKKLSLVKLPSLKPLSNVTSRAPSPPVKVSVSSPHSPTSNHADHVLPINPLSALARDTHIVERALLRLPLPHAGGLGLEAVDEAIEELRGFVEFVEYLSSRRNAEKLDVSRVMDKSRETPMLLAFPVLLSSFSSESLASWIGLSDEEYRTTCLSGFAKADECASIVGRAVLKNPKSFGLGWLRDWLERTVKEEEEDSSSDEDEEDGAQA